MVTYVLSQHPSYWSVTRYTDEQSEPRGQSSSEENALEIILKLAVKDRPSQVLRIGLNGDSRVIAKFDTERIDLAQLASNGIRLSPKLLEQLQQEQEGISGS